MSKKILALILSFVMLAGGLSGCAPADPDDKGATLNIYLAADPTNTSLDPAKMLYTAESGKYLNLLFEGLTKFDEKGNVVKGMASRWYTKIDEEAGTYKMFFEIRESRWNDGTPVQSAQFVYAWKRILEPDFESPAAALLFNIKNARAVKAGEMTIDDLGLRAPSPDLLEVEFEGPFDVNEFLLTVASLALVPLRDDTVDPNPDDWYTKPISFVTNGPFQVKTMEYIKNMVLERSTYYYTAENSTEKYDKYVTPQRINIMFSETLLKYEELFSTSSDPTVIQYMGILPVEKFEDYKDEAIITNMTSTFCFFFNIDNNPLFKSEKVRLALSIALNRETIAAFASNDFAPATGFVPHGVFDKDNKTYFRTVGGDLLPKTGDIEKAKSLLKEAGVSSGSFTIKVRNIAHEEAIANYAAEVWRSLGFNVTVAESIKGKAIGETITTKNYDIMAYDFQAVLPTAYAVLAPFALTFSGSRVEFLDNNESIQYPFIPGFQNDEYDALMEEIFLLKTNAERVEKLHQLEQLLIDQSPVIPLFFYKNVEVYKELTGLTYNPYGFTNFTKANFKNYRNYTTTTEATTTTEQESE